MTNSDQFTTLFARSSLRCFSLAALLNEVRLPAELSRSTILISLTAILLLPLLLSRVHVLTKLFVSDG